MAEREPTILLTGVNGQLGHQLRTALASLGNIVALNRTELNLSQADSILQALERHQPDIIVNPAAYTAVDRAESEVEQARSVNAAAPASSDGGTPAPAPAPAAGGDSSSSGGTSASAPGGCGSSCACH